MRKMRRLAAAAAILSIAVYPVLAGPLDLPAPAGFEDLNAFYDGGKRPLAASPVLVHHNSIREPAPAHEPAPPAKKREVPDWLKNDPERQKWLHDLLNPPHEQQPRYFLGDEIGGRAMGAFRPVYGVVEGLSDGIYDILRVHLVGNIFPSRLTKELKAPPKEDSFAQFDRNFHDNELRFFRWIHENDPNRVVGYGQRTNYAEQENFKRLAAERQLSVLLSSLTQTALGRYQLERAGKNAGKYAQNTRNWDPSFLAMAGVIGGGVLYIDGLHANADIWDVRLGIDLRAGHRIRSAVENGSRLEEMGCVEAGYKDNPFTLSACSELEKRQVKLGRSGLRYQIRF